MTQSNNPLTGPPPAEDPWVGEERVRVIAQVWFGEVLSISEMVPQFQEAIRDEYPVFELDFEMELSAGGAGDDDEAREVRTWRFFDTAREWRVVLSSGRLTLETSRFAGRDEFLRRLRELLTVLGGHVRPTLGEGVGVRAFDRLPGENVGYLSEQIHPDFLGQSGPLPGGSLRLSITHKQYELLKEDAWLATRWGLVPPRNPIHPESVEPIDQPAWILDLDTFAPPGEECEFDIPEIEGRARKLIDRLQAVFATIVAQAFRTSLTYDSTTSRPFVLRSDRPAYSGAEDGARDGDPADGGSLVRDGAGASVPESPPAGSEPPGAPAEPIVDTRPPCLKALIELRLTAGLTFEQAARLLGVSRRTIHLWVTRRRMSATNEERLMRTLAVLRRADRGDAWSTRAALLEAASDGRVPFDLIAEGRLDEARELLGEGPGRKWLPYWPLSREEQEKRKPLPPWILMDARDDVVHKDVGRSRGVKTHRVRRGRDKKRD